MNKNFSKGGCLVDPSPEQHFVDGVTKKGTVPGATIAGRPLRLHDEWLMYNGSVYLWMGVVKSKDYNILPTIPVS